MTSKVIAKTKKSTFLPALLAAGAIGSSPASRNHEIFPVKKCRHFDH